MSALALILLVHAERLLSSGRGISLNKGRKMLIDLAVIVFTVLMVGAFMLAAYHTGYREGHGDGYLRGRNIAKALKEAERK